MTKTSMPAAIRCAISGDSTGTNHKNVEMDVCLVFTQCTVSVGNLRRVFGRLSAI